MNSIIVKTIFIQGDNRWSKKITWGLNNQIPIKSEDFEANSKEVFEINEILSKYKMRILRSGELDEILTTFTPSEFIKKYFAVGEKPGTSKNLNKSKLDSYLNNALKELKDEKKSEIIIKKILMIVDIEKWWSRKIRGEEIKTTLLKYGKIYFESYVSHYVSDVDEIDDIGEEYFSLKYDEFMDCGKSINIDINDFKSDEKFECFIKTNDNPDIQKFSKEYFEIIKDKLIKYINSEKNGNYANNYLIRKFCKKENKEISNFRIIPMKNEQVKEHYPLPNSTFSELYKRDNYLNDDDYPEFEKSKFYQQVNLKYPIFVIYMNDDDVNDIKYFDEFSLNMMDNVQSKAKTAYKKTITAFKEGDVSILPKVSDNNGFHVRPKAMNGNDTFVFTDGNEITKRTFWANSKDIYEIVKKLKDAEK